MPYLKTHWPHLLATLLGSVVSTAFALGFASATTGSRLTNAERRLEEVDKSRVAETRWQVQQNTAAIAASQLEARQTESLVAQIHTRLGIIDRKLDAIAEALKRR
jgi:uncharacterized membrane protein YccC